MRRIGLLVILGLSWMGRTAHASEACPVLIDLVPKLSSALEQAMMEEAKGLAAEAVAALECQPQPVDSLMITSVLNLAGVTHFFANELNTAQRYFAWSAAVSPAMNLDAMYGATAAASYDAARQQVLEGGEASVHVHGANEVWVDGRGLPSGTPMSFPAGTHLIQKRLYGVMESEVVTLARDTVHDVGEPEVEAASPVASTGAGDKAGGPMSGQILMIAGGGMTAAGAVLLLLATNAHKDFDESTDVDELESLQSRTNALGAAGIGVGLSGVAVMGLGSNSLGSEGVSISLGGRW